MDIVKPKGKCFAKRCNDCNWFRQREMEKLGPNGMPTGVHEMLWACEFEVLLGTMNYHMGSLDGLQSAINTSNNRAHETQEVLKSFGTDLGTKLIEVK